MIRELHGVKYEHNGFTESLDETWEPETFGVIDAYVRGGTFVDVGAWNGLFSVFASRLADRVLALEPDPVARAMLFRTLELNRAKNVEVLPVALWSGPSVALHSHTEWGDSMTGPTRKGEGHVFDAITVADLQGRVSDASLVKVDIEGGESEVIEDLCAWGVPLLVSIHEPELTKPLPMVPREKRMFRDANSPYYMLLIP